MMQNPNPEWELDAKWMIYDFRVFNAEMFDVPSGTDIQSKVEQSNFEELEKEEMNSTPF